MKTYRDYARAEHGVRAPEAVFPVTAHVAFDKACHYLGIRPIQDRPRSRQPCERPRGARGDHAQHHRARRIGAGFPHGLIDPIEELSELARARGVGFHNRRVSRRLRAAVGAEARLSRAAVRLCVCQA